MTSVAVILVLPQQRETNSFCIYWLRFYQRQELHFIQVRDRITSVGKDDDYYDDAENDAEIWKRSFHWNISSQKPHVAACSWHWVKGTWINVQGCKHCCSWRCLLIYCCVYSALQPTAKNEVPVTLQTGTESRARLLDKVKSLTTCGFKKVQWQINIPHWREPGKKLIQCSIAVFWQRCIESKTPSPDILFVCHNNKANRHFTHRDRRRPLS